MYSVYSIGQLLGRAVLVLGLLGGSTTFAQTYPSKPISILVGFGAGGAFDTVMRALAEEMSKSLGQPVTVDNRPGAGGAIATQAAVAAPADGYTLLAAGLQLANGPHLNKVNYVPQTDLTMVRQVASVPVLLLTHANSPIHTAADIVGLAKKNGNGVTIGTGGPGTTGHFGTFLVSSALNVPTIHVPFRGGAPALMALSGGELDLVFDQPSGAMQGLIDSKKIRVVSLMQERTSPALPGIKNVKQFGMPLQEDLRGWQGIAVKTGTPEAVVKRLNAAVASASTSVLFRARINQLGLDLITDSSPAEFQKLYISELDRWGAFIKKHDIKAN
jgi:tripartite-type tricarboxylate transporter receptor subunit TctC